MNCQLSKKNCLLLLLLAAVWPGIASGQQMTSNQMAALESSVSAGVDPYFVESRDTISEYGPDCITRNLLQDRKGAYWLATWKGIIKYDGKVFTNYTLKEGLIHFHVAECYEDRKGNLWFGTVRGGLYRYDGKTFRLFTTKDGLAGNTVSCFAEDKKGNIWFGTDKGASCYNGVSFTNLTMQDGLPSNMVNAILTDGSGKLWFGCGATRIGGDDGGLVSYDGKSLSTFTCPGHAPFKTVGDLFRDKAGNLWIGGMDGLSIYNGTSVTDLATHLSYYITDDAAGNVWLTTTEPPGEPHPSTPNQMLCRYDGKKLVKVLEKYERGDFQIFGKIVDKKGDVWFGTMKGVCRYDGQAFTYFSKDRR